MRTLKFRELNLKKKKAKKKVPKASTSHIKKWKGLLSMIQENIGKNCSLWRNYIIHPNRDTGQGIKYQGKNFFKEKGVHWLCRAILNPGCLKPLFRKEHWCTNTGEQPIYNKHTKNNTPQSVHPYLSDFNQHHKYASDRHKFKLLKAPKSCKQLLKNHLMSVV